MPSSKSKNLAWVTLSIQKRSRHTEGRIGSISITGFCRNGKRCCCRVGERWPLRPKPDVRLQLQYVETRCLSAGPCPLWLAAVHYPVSVRHRSQLEPSLVVEGKLVDDVGAGAIVTDDLDRVTLAV